MVLRRTPDESEVVLVRGGRMTLVRKLVREVFGRICSFKESDRFLTANEARVVFLALRRKN